MERVGAVGVGRADPGGKKAGELVNEVDLSEIGRRKCAVDRGGGPVRKHPGSAERNASLRAELRSEADRIKNRPRKHLVDEVGVVEDVVAVGRVVIGGAVEGEINGVDRA